MNVILFGAPGAGKGSQAKLIEQIYNTKQISTGELLRDSIKKNDAIGKIAKEFTDKGNLVPDSLVLEMLEKRILEDDCKSGIILDGFPRTITQADNLNNLFKKINQKLDYVFHIDVPFEILLVRLTSRRICLSCGKDYNLFSSPSKSEKCDICGGLIIQRDDDNEDSIRNRLIVFSRSTEPLIEYFRNKNILSTINGNRAVKNVFEDIRKIMDKGR